MQVRNHRDGVGRSLDQPSPQVYVSRRIADRDARKALLPLPVGQGASPKEVALDAAPSPPAGDCQLAGAEHVAWHVTLAAMQR